jgi:5-methylcytosine-specific restriction endonuclease McrA
MAGDPRKTRHWRYTVVPLVKASYPWVCHLCGQAIPTDVGWRDPLAFEADHVLTVSTHPELAYELSNLRPSHRRCNTARRDRPLTLALVGELTERFTVYTPPALRFFGE